MTYDDILNSVSVPILISTLSKITFISFMTALHLHQLCRVLANSQTINFHLMDKHSIVALPATAASSINIALNANKTGVQAN